MKSNMSACKLCVLTLAMLLAGMLAWAGGQTEPAEAKSAEKVTITFTIWGEEAKLKAHQNIVDAFEKENPDIEINMIAIPSDQYQQKVLTMIAGGTPPDVINCSEAFTYAFYKRGLMLDIREDLKKAGLLDEDKHFTNLFAAFTDPYGSAIFAVPTGSNVNVIYYNKNMYQEAGLSSPKENWNWVDFVETATALTKDKDGDGTIDQFGFSAHNLQGYYLNQDVLWSFGGHWLDDPLKPTKSIIDTPEVAEALQFMRGLRHKYRVAPKAAEQGAFQGGFASGKVAMELNGTWMVAFHKEIEDFEWDIQYIPTGKRRATSFAVGGWGVTADSKHRAEAIRVMLFWGGPVFQTENCIKLGLVTPLTKELAYSEAFMTLGGKAPANHKIRMDGIIGSHFRALVHTKGPEITDLWNKEVENLLTDKLSVDEFIAKVKPKLDELLAQN